MVAQKGVKASISKFMTCSISQKISNIKLHNQLSNGQNDASSSKHVGLHEKCHKEINLPLEKSYTDG